MEIAEAAPNKGANRKTKCNTLNLLWNKALKRLGFTNVKQKNLPC
jgi:hypothetical protein